MREKKHFILIFALAAIRLFAQPALPITNTNQAFAPIANAYSGSWIFYATNPASGLGFLNGASIPYVTTTSNVLSGQIGAANSLALTIGGNATNYANAVGLSATNLILQIGANDTNFTYLIGLNATNYTEAAIIADTNFPFGLNADNINVTNSLVAGGNITIDGTITATTSHGFPTAIWSGTSGTSKISGGATDYFSPNNSNSTHPTSYSRSETSIPMTRTMTLTNLYVVTSGAVGSGKTDTLTLLTNGVASPLSVTISGTSQTTGNDTTHSVTISASTDVGIKITTQSGSTTAFWSWSFEGE